MKPIPMRGRLAGKRIAGYLWAGPGKRWMKKENYFQLEDDKLVTAGLARRCWWLSLEPLRLRPRSGRIGTAERATDHRLRSSDASALGANCPYPPRVSLTSLLVSGTDCSLPSALARIRLSIVARH